MITLRPPQSMTSYWLLLLMLICQHLVGSMTSHVVLMPFPYRSHVTEFASIGKGLLERGHSVTILLPMSYPELDRLRNESGFQVVDYALADPDFYTIDYSKSSTDWVSNAIKMDPVDEMRNNVEGFREFCTNPLSDGTLPDRLLRSSYGRPDLAIVDGSPMQRCLWILCHQLDVPYVSMTTQYEPWLWRVPSLPSFVPFSFAAGGRLTEQMTFWQRVENARSLVDWTAFPRVEFCEDDFVQRYVPGETYATLAARSLLWFFDTDMILDYPRPTMPNEINVGGLSTRPARPLSAGPLETFASQSVNKLVIVSFGTIDYASSRFFTQLFDAFRQVSELNFVWRYEGEIPAMYADEKSWPKNIITHKWIPQNDLLGHNNTVLFVGHCGANSQYESVYNGIPMICLALWGDQMYNAARMQYRGYGLSLGRFGSVQTDRLVDAIRQVAFNQTYSDNVRRASAIFRSRPMNSRQTAVWWVEHVIQHGASHLHSHAVDMVWYEYLMLDILALFVLLPVAAISSLCTALACWICGHRKRHNSNSNGATTEQSRVDKKRQ